MRVYNSKQLLDNHVRHAFHRIKGLNVLAANRLIRTLNNTNLLESHNMRSLM